MEDDYDLNLIEYWNFDYYYMMNRIPKNWDCVQLGYENRKLINFFLHPILIGSGFGPCVLTRHYVEKLVKIHYIDGKFFLLTNKSHMAVREIWGLLDNFVTKDGVTYCLPLITNNPDLDSDHGGDEKMSVRPWHFECRDLYYWWWTEMHHKFTLDDFFTYHKVNDWKMTKNLEFLNKKRIILLHMNSKNEWDPLKKVLVGVADFARIPNDTSVRVVNYADVTDDSNIPFGAYPQKVIDEANEDLDNFVDFLESQSVEVVRATKN